MVSFRHSCHILDMLNSLPIFSLTILCGNNHQLKAFAKQDSHIRTVRNLFDNHLLLFFCRTTVLTEQMRCTDLQYSRLLQTVHHLTLSDRDVRRHFLKLSTIRDLHTQVTPDDIVRCFRQCQQTTFVTFSNYASDIVNQAILRHLFCDCEPIIFFLLRKALTNRCQFISECESLSPKIVTRLVDLLTETSASFIPIQITLLLFVAIINWLPSFQ